VAGLEPLISLHSPSIAGLQEPSIRLEHVICIIKLDCHSSRNHKKQTGNRRLNNLKLRSSHHFKMKHSKFLIFLTTFSFPYTTTGQIEFHEA
jgi:hypothetical protein